MSDVRSALVVLTFKHLALRQTDSGDLTTVTKHKERLLT
jgi:hypothetical protein